MNFKQWEMTFPLAAQELRRVSTSVTPIQGATSEADTQARIRVEAGRCGFAMWRNNNGAATVIDDNGETRHVRYGLGNDSAQLNKLWKSSDLIGVGPGGRFVACEVKHPGWTKPTNDRDLAQSRMLHQVNALGGIGFFATHVNHYKEQINGKT